MAKTALSVAFDKISKSLSPNMVVDAETYKVPRIKLSSPRLNYLYGGGLAVGRIHRLIGPESGGKSTVATLMGVDVQHQKDHNVVVYLDFERSFDPEHAKDLGLDVTDAATDPNGKFIWLKPDNIEDSAAALEELLKTNMIGLVIFDSEAQAAPRGVIEGEFNKADFGSQAKALKNFCVRFTPLLDNYGAAMIVISQERANMQMMSHAITFTGGYALKYAASTLFRVRRVEYLTDAKGNSVGIHMFVKNMKNKTGVPNRECDLDLYFDGGLDSTGEYIDFVKDLAGESAALDELMIYSGGYYKSKKWNLSLHGKNAFVDWTKDPANAEKFNEIKTAIDNLLAGTLSTDDTTNKSEAEIDEALADEQLKDNNKKEDADDFNE